MDFFQLAKSRFSVRKYKTTPVEDDKLLKVLEAGQVAPSAVNFQPWHFIVVTETETLEKIHQTYQRDWIKKAPVIIVAGADHSQSWKRSSDGKDSADIDIAIAVDHMTLMATELGLGTCWVCNFSVKKCSEVLKLPSHIEPCVLIPLGYPDIENAPKKRKSLSEFVHLNTFGNAFN
ncbi:nitroreductase family protein [Prolixibacteraceae bacterium Z1-6]|uniref:Nitroreductase family protein n=1 Tax=Draconibacterium aestuarii TaxID=2998507 RepID=A0A9X3J710_9BACT|nr:nitroreductase family protein [Prolixibacteraceae bacterium Z1-6]